jgi:hypothetical protein
MSDYIGFKWLAEQLKIDSVQLFAVESKVGSARRTFVVDHIREETYPVAQRPEGTIADHLTFALKHEVVNLEFLYRLFAAIDQRELETWILNERTGAYARRAGFFFEWLTGRRLDVPDLTIGNYVDALDPGAYLVAARATNVQRWRVRDNMPGTSEFCPIIERTQAVARIEGYDCAQALLQLEREYGADLLMRSAVWLSIKESRASFQIEHEERHVDRVRRFAAAMENRCGRDGDPLSAQVLGELQAEILGVATRYGLRKSPVIVGHTSGFSDIVDYIAPHWDHTESLLQGLQSFLAKTRGMTSMLRAAVASFGFVYIHPMADGNGRISRFLINDVLRRDGAVPAPFILPVSATITDSARERAGYDRSLEVLSKPLMLKYQDRYKFSTLENYADGVESNFHFDAYDDALPAWRYPNLTQQCEFVGHVVQLTIEVEMSKEASYLRGIERAREGVKDYLEGPNTDIDQIIRSVRDNGWKLSNKLIKTFPQLQDEALGIAVVNAVRDALTPPLPVDDDEQEPMDLPKL